MTALLECFNRYIVLEADRKDPVMVLKSIMAKRQPVNNVMTITRLFLLVISIPAIRSIPVLFLFL